VPVQSEFATQTTHALVTVSHTGAAAEVHCVEFVQPARQAPSTPHTGVVPLQSVFDAHSTQRLLALQRGVDPEQFESESHCTQVCVELQTLRVVGQSVELRHPTQAPVEVSHVSPLAHARPPASGRHEAPHVCVAG
jgi:hypothetical protein